jgi:chemotaxis protein histidine kinase CheA
MAGASKEQKAELNAEIEALGIIIPEIEHMGEATMTLSQAQSAQAALTSMVVSMLRQQKEAEKQALQDKLDAYTKSIDAQKAALDAQKKAITDATDAYTKMADAEKTALKAEEDAYTKVIDAEKTKIQLMHDEQAYKDELSKKEQAVSETQMQLDALSLDNSQEAAAQRLKLQDTLTTQTADLNKTQADKQYTDQQTALDNELAAYKAEKDGEIAAIQSAEDAYKSASDARIKLIENEQSALDNNLKVYTTNIQNQEKAIDDYVSKSGIMVQDALQLIATNSATLYQDLINWNAVYGTGIENDVTKAWMDASAAAAYYQAIVSANSGLINTVKDVYAAKKASGFASGGLVVGGIEGQDSVHTKLMPGEGVLNKTAMNFLGVSGLNNLNRGLPATTSTGGNGGIQISMPISVAGNLDKAILPDLEKMISKTFEKLNSTLAQRGIRRTTNQYAN